MIEQIKEIQEQGFKPIIFIDHTLSKIMRESLELSSISKAANKLGIPLYNEDNIVDLNRVHKAYVFRYGCLPLDTEAKVKRKGGKIVSGNLKV